MARNKVYVCIRHGNDTVAVIYDYESAVTLYGAAGDKIREYVSKKYNDKAFVDTRFVKDGKYLNPNKTLLSQDTGVYEMEVYVKDK